MSALEWSPGVPVTIDNLAPVFHRCIEVADTAGVEHCLRLAAVVDPHVAEEWLTTLDLAVSLTVRAAAPTGGEE